MFRSNARRWLACMIVAVLGSAARSLAATPEEIDAAIQKGCAYLYKVQNPTGDWEVRTPSNDWGTRDIIITGKFRGGLTGMAMWALLSSGERPNDPRILRGLDYLKKADIPMVYGKAVRMQVYSLLPPSNEIKRLASVETKTLLSLMHRTGEATGLYFYDPTPADQYDHSISQFAVLGVSAGESMGVEVPDEYWQITDRAWRRHQDPTGGWSYVTGDPKNGVNTPSMTAAGIATLFISKSELMSGRSADVLNTQPDPNIDRGFAWIGDHFNDSFLNTDTVTYTLFGMARIGVASGYKYFGTVDWFDRGADWLVKNQKPDGSWGKAPGDFWGANLNGVPCTAFSVLFLLRGRAPVMINKLDYSAAATPSPDAKAPPKDAIDHWNNRPRDAFNLAHWAGKQFEHDMNWQVVNLQVAASDLHDAPLLLLDGSAAINLSEEQQSKLRQFVEEGGILLGNADGGSAPFEQSFIKLGKALFPNYEFRQLPESHPIYTGQMFNRKKWATPMNLSGLSNGVRELMILASRNDLSKAWQQSTKLSSEPALQLGTDIYLYSVDGRIPRWKNDRPIIKPPQNKSPETKFTVLRLEYDGNWDPEPGGWRRMKQVALASRNLSLDVQTVKLGRDPLPRNALAHLTGTTGIKLSAPELASLRNFIDDGGTLLVDAAGGSSAFATSIEGTLRDLFGADADQLQTPLPLDNAIYGSGDDKIDHVKYRRFAEKVIGSSRAPRLRGMTLHGRLAVIYSPEDLSNGLVGQNVDGIVGYDPDSASVLVTRILFGAYLGTKSSLSEGGH